MLMIAETLYTVRLESEVQKFDGRVESLLASGERLRPTTAWLLANDGYLLALVLVLTGIGVVAVFWQKRLASALATSVAAILINGLIGTWMTWAIAPLLLPLVQSVPQ